MARNIPNGQPNTPENIARRRAELLAAALPLAAQHGYDRISRAMVAEAAGVAPTLINFYFRHMSVFRSELIAWAIRHSQVDVVAQAMLAGHPAAATVPAALRQAVAGRMLAR